MNAQVLRLAAPADARPAFMAFGADDATRAVMIEAAEMQGYDATTVVAGDLSLVIASLRDIPTPEILVVDLDGDLSPADAVERLAEVCDPEAYVVLIGSVNDVTFYRGLMAAGVGDYLVKPVSPDQLAGAMRKPAPVETTQTVQPLANGIRIGIVGARGGVGATSVATSLAWVFANEYKITTGLVDLDVCFGSVALALDVEPNRGLADAVENPARIDDLFIERATLNVSENLGVLASEAEPASVQVSPDAVMRLTEHLQRSFAAVIMDVPRTLLGGGAPVSAFDHIVLVTEPTLAGARDAVRLKSMLLGAGLDEQALHVVVNRAGLLAKGELDAKTMAATGQLEVRYTLPFDVKSAAAAIARGRALVQAAGKSKLAKALRALAHELAPLDEEETPRGLARLFRRRA